jgi:hypothetical protein
MVLIIIGEFSSPGANITRFPTHDIFLHIGNIVLVYMNSRKIPIGRDLGLEFGKPCFVGLL